MGDAVSGDGEFPDGAAVNGGAAHGFKVTNITDKGDIVLDVTFETSPETLRKSRKAALAASRRAGNTAAPRQELKPKTRVAYRVNLGALKRNSQYFANLLSNSQFREAQIISEAHDRLKAQGVPAGEAENEQLPWIPIADDDEATKAAGREHAFEDMLRIIHGETPKTTRVTMSFVTTLAVTADRFDCSVAVSRCLNGELKFKWPVTTNKPMRDDTGRPTEVEQVLRQKVLVAWLLGQPLRLQHATRELIMRGSCHWSAFHDSEADITAAWCNLPDGLEHELQYRRECILNAIASVQRHFLQLYSSRERQCKLGYDSSTACDSFQLGQLLKFLVSKGLVFLVDYSPVSLDAVPDTSMLDLDELLATLRQCPSYQVDKYHTNCGPRIRVEPVLDYIRAMLSANVISVPLADWKRRREDVSWVVNQTSADLDDKKSKTFQFTRALANDSRLKMEGAMYADRMAKKLFTAEEWNWTPEM